MNEHRHVEELAARAMDGALAAADADRLEAHLAVCADCRQFAAALLTDEALARTRTRPEAPARVREAVVAAALRPASPATARPVLPLVGAFAVALLLLAGISVVGRLRTQEAAQLPPRSWVPLGDASPFVDAKVWDVVRTEANLLVLGETGERDQLRPAAWMTTDGLTWTPIPPEALFSGGLGQHLAANGDTMVVLGNEAQDRAGQLPRAPRAWLTHGQRSCDSCPNLPSDDPWQDAATVFPHGAGTMIIFDGLIAGGPGFVAVGTEAAFPVEPGVVPPIGARVASSTDGSTWTLNDPRAPAFDAGWMHDVAAGPAGIVAVGETALAGTIWYSADGSAWTRLAGALSPASASVRSVAAGPGGFVAVGDDGGVATAWTSSDGRSWRGSPASPSLQGARMLWVRRLGSSFVATGQTASGDGVAWESPDGEAWTRLDTGSIFRNASIERAASIGSRLILFGIDTTEGFGVPYPATKIAVGDLVATP
jgi:hypothetical protein